MSIKQEIIYAENLCRELEKRAEELEKKLEQNDDPKLKNTRSRQVMALELKEVQKLLKKYTEQLDHLRTHDSITLKFVMALSLLIFTIWMIVVLTSNWGKSNVEIESEGLI